MNSIQAAIRDVTELTAFLQQLKHVEKFAAVRHVLAAAGHALNNPLAVIRLSVQVAQMMGEEPDYKEIITQVDRCVRTIRGLEVYTAGRRDETFVTDVNEVLDQAVLLTHAQLMATGIQLEVNVPPSRPSVQGDPYSLQRSFINIMTNAWEAREDST